jgi:glc operon protein GlcG
MPLISKPILTLDVAKQIAAAAQAEAITNSWNVAIAIVDPAGLLVYFQKLDDTQLGSVEVSQAKARCAALYKRPSKALADVVTGGNVAMMSLPGVLAVEGGLPLFADGQIVGAIGISGVMSNQDGIIAKAGVDAFSAIAAS